MSYGKETFHTGRGTPIDTEPHRTNQNEFGGVVAHWGERISDSDLKDRISEAHPGTSHEENTGFKEIYHQAYGTSREEGIRDELEVAELVGQQTMELNGWKPEDIAGLYVGSGVPIADDSRYPNYAEVIAERLGLPEQTQLHTSYIACASGGHELISALSNPELQGKPTLVMGMEGITYLTADFNPENADAMSMRFFSNGSAGIGVVPGENMTLLHAEQLVDTDTKGALAAKMTYEDLIDSEGETWQERNNIEMIKLPTPEGDMRINMQGPRTGLFFAKNVLSMLSNMKEEVEKHNPSYIVAHHPSLGVNNHVVKKLKAEGIDIPFDWVVDDGNSSAATSLIAELRQLDKAQPGTVQLFMTYGAGGSFDAALIHNQAV